MLQCIDVFLYRPGDQSSVPESITVRVIVKWWFSTILAIFISYNFSLKKSVKKNQSSMHLLLWTQRPFTVWMWNVLHRLTSSNTWSPTGRAIFGDFRTARKFQAGGSHSSGAGLEDYSIAPLPAQVFCFLLCWDGKDFGNTACYISGIMKDWTLSNWETN